ncbi:Stk1 family PASTA domain-containing Ser/Thr kinase [Nocardioides sp. AE5]|uniref:Stk1 family PASTA domain-containing Ser/Thr kinase n=1 Tax=Nocardioides sp. AE5 TaxID=2962573 RepID=UPI002881D71E|nr:Stk1 family PASTA domain-containing Ser/Thr kinase [Nocardioides sp. AE5]MDT0201230.1 Stk1 family PASTA domain-containing Ser/Thr kinase [Nocardioides sp. AE5]
MEPGTQRDPSDPLIGRVLDRRYRIDARIASGGMASVYEAHDERLDRVVALKVMHPGMGEDGDFAARFVREARHAARLSHPNVVNVFDQGEEHGTVYLAMEYVPGHTLRDVITKDAPMAPQKALALIEPVLSALRAAHRANLIHRDIKPENVLIAEDTGASHGAAPRIKVADFGLAKAISADTQHTATGGVLIGTVSYLAPELVVDGRADARADVYAAGVVLYELLTGRKPHEGETPIQVAYKHVHEDIGPPSALAPGIPAYVDALVARATARDRELRPADAGVLLHQVHRVQQALAEGVVDDPDLVADLSPAATPREVEDAPDAADQDVAAPVPAPPAPREDTAKDPLEESGAAPAAEHTSMIAVGATPPPQGPYAAGPVGPGAAPEQAPDASQRHSRKGLVVVLVAIVLALTVGLGAWWFGFARYTTTPGVLSLSAADAKDRLEGAGLTYVEGDPVYSETVEKGLVISTDPKPGDRVLDGGEVTVVLSLGKERYDVPTVEGMSVDEAQKAIQDTNLDFGKAIEVYHDEVPEGQVIDSDPAAGTSLKPGTTVDITVSKGPEPIPVVDWTGKKASEATKALEELDLKVETTEAFSDSVAEGNVISQSPSSGEVFKGDTITLEVSKGPQMVDVPRVRGMGVEAATKALEDAGFKVKVEQHQNYVGLHFVLTQSPSGGKAPKGSTVTIVIV